ncbi:MAG: trypsin-like peptidase domain-containing protein [Planctomycetota bacterium]
MMGHRHPLRLLSLLLMGALAFGMLQESSFSQEKVEKALRDGTQLRDLFVPVIAKARRSVVQIAGSRRRQVYGVVVRRDGWIVTKASEINDAPVCEFQDGRNLKARVAGISKQHDLALLKVDAKNLQPVEWHLQDKWQVGQWLATAGHRRLPVGVGILSNPLRAHSGKSRGFLGVVIENHTRGALVTEVTPKSGAANAGIAEGDVIEFVARAKISGQQSLIEAIGEFKPDDSIKIGVYRRGKKIEVEAILGAKTAVINLPSYFRRSRTRLVSRRRDGFKTWLRHDTVMSARDCGSLLVDLHGHVVGLNIARAGRTMTRALPSGVVKSVVAELIAKDRETQVKSAEKRQSQAPKKIKGSL